MDQKKSRVIAQRDRKQLIFLMKHLSIIQGTGVGGQKKKQTSTEFYFMQSVLLKYRDVLSRWSDWLSPEHTLPVNLL